MMKKRESKLRSGTLQHLKFREKQKSQQKKPRQGTFSEGRKDV